MESAIDCSFCLHAAAIRTQDSSDSRFVGRYVRAKWLKVLEVMLVAIISAVVALLMIYGIDQCVSLDEDNATPYPIQVSIDL